MKYKKQITLVNYFVLFALTLTSCIEEPKKKPEAISSSDQFEKVIDDAIGVSSINPNGIQAGDENDMVQTLTISNSLTREIFRRKFKVLSVECREAQDPDAEPNDCSKNPKQRRFVFEVNIIERDGDNNVAKPAVSRELVLLINNQGFYEFFGDPVTEQTQFSWDTILDIRGFCKSFRTETYDVQVSCTNLKVEAEVWGMTSVPVRKISVNRNVNLVNLETGETIDSKLRFTLRVANGLKEISKVVSFCSEGLQKFENQVYYLTRCNNLEGL